VDEEALPVGLPLARHPYVAPAADALARLRIFEHGILAIEGVLGLEIAGVRRGPVPVERGADVLVCHRVLLRRDSVAAARKQDTLIAMSETVLVFYGSYREPRHGIRLARYATSRLNAQGVTAELIDAREIGLPMLSRMYKEHPKGTAPAAMEALAARIKAARGFVFVCGEYNWGIQPGLKNLTDHFLEEWFWRPAAVIGYSLQRAGGARANYSWHGILSEMGMVVVSSSISIGAITEALDEKGDPTGESGKYLDKAFPRVMDDLVWWMEAAAAQRLRSKPPY
jgi:NAD(P)H-dependent FMN reductase